MTNLRYCVNNIVNGHVLSIRAEDKLYVMFRSLATHIGYTQNTHTTRLTYSNTVCYTLVLLVVVVSRGFVRMWVRNNSSISGAIRTPGMLKIDASGKKKRKSAGDILYLTKTKFPMRVSELVHAVTVKA